MEILNDYGVVNSFKLSLVISLWSYHGYYCVSYAINLLRVKVL